MSSHIMCCSSSGVGDWQVLSTTWNCQQDCQRMFGLWPRLLTLHNLPITFLATNCTFADAKATAVSAIISTIGEPRPELTDLWMKLSSTMSINSGTWPMEPQIFAWIDGYISTSSMVSRINFSNICATCFCRLFSSDGLQNLLVVNNLNVSRVELECIWVWNC